MRHVIYSLFLLLASASVPAQADTGGTHTYSVLCYHNVLDEPLADPEKFTVSTADLVQHFSWLKENGYTVISVDDLLKAKAGKQPLPPKAVMLTFDDGYRSFYTRVYPLLKEFHYPAVLALVGSWLQLKPEEQVPYEGHHYTRQNFLAPDEIREMSMSGLVEIASHSYDLHHGVLGNPQGNLLPAAIARTYDAQQKSYEGDDAYLARIRTDLAQNSAFIHKITGKRPRVMVWPYGRYNLVTVEIAQSLGMPLMLTLDEGMNSLENPAWQTSRVLIAFNTTVADLSAELSPVTSPRLERVMHVDLDYVYDPDPARQEVNLGKLLDRVKAMKASTVYLQAYADPDGNGAADSVYFPNRVLPMRADLFNRVAWQLRTRAGAKVFAWMPLLAFELPADHPLAKHRVASDAQGKPNSGYPRLTPFDAQARRLIAGLYEDLAKHAIFEGILFHDDAVLTDYEDASPWALDYYSREWGLPASISQIRSNPGSMAKWTANKTRFLTDFSLELAQVIRRYQPQAKTARNIYAEVVLNPNAQEWFAQSLPDFLRSYDYTAVMAMPFMENAKQPLPWLAGLVQEIAKQPQGLQKAVFELQAMDWRSSTPVDSRVLLEQMRLLQTQGARNFGYYPDDFLNNSPDLEVIKPAFSLQDFPFTGQTK